MKKNYVCVILISLIPVKLLNAQSNFNPNPNNAMFIGLYNEWLVWQTSSIDKATIWHRAPSYKYNYYLQKDIDSKSTLLPFEYTSTGAAVYPIWVFEDGKTAFSEGNALTFVTAQKKLKSIILDTIKIDSCVYGSNLLGANKYGVFMQPYNSNGKAPVFFIPWSTDDELAFEKKILITDQKGVSVDNIRDIFYHNHKSNYAYIFDAPILYQYNLLNGNIDKIKLKSYREDRGNEEWWFPEIIDSDENTILIRNESNYFEVNMETKEQFLISKDFIGKIIAFKNNTAYMITSEDDSNESGSYTFSLKAFNIKSKKKQTLIKNIGRGHHGDGLLLSISHTEKLILWIYKDKYWKYFNWL